MGYDRELEDILASIKQDKDKINELLNSADKQEEKSVSRTARNAQPFVKEEIKAEFEESIKPIEPPEHLNREAIVNEIAKEESPVEIKMPEPPKPGIKEKKEHKSKPEKQNKEKTAFPIKERFSALLKIARNKFITKQALIIIAVIVAIAAIVPAGIGIYNYSKTAYLKPYEQKYHIEYPEGILEQFCDQYGKNQSTVGAVAIEDTNDSFYVTSKKSYKTAFAPKGTDVYTTQQFRAVDVTGKCDIESIYSTISSFVNSSQKVTFNTLFEKKEYQVIGAYYTNKSADDDNGYIFPYNIYGTMAEKSFDHFADSIKHRSLYNTGYEMTYDKNYLSLYADSDFMDNFVFVIVCAEIDKDFEKITDVSQKEKIHYPQVWYNTNNVNNPYIFSGHWYPEIITIPEMQKCRKLTATDYDFN